MGLLDGGLRDIMGAAFGPLYPDGTLLRRVRTEAENGDVSVAVVPVAVKVQTSSVTEAMRMAPGYTERSVKFRVLQAGIGAAPTSDDHLATGGVTWSLSMVAADTAATSWIMMGTPS